MSEAAVKPKGNRVAPPSVFRRYGSQMGIIGVGLAMWAGFIIAAPTVFLDVDIYKAFAQTTPLFARAGAGPDLRRHHRRDRPFLPLDHGAGNGGVLPAGQGRAAAMGRLARRLRHRCALRLDQRRAGRPAQHPLAGHHHRHLVPLSRRRAGADERHRRRADAGQIPGHASAAELGALRHSGRNRSGPSSSRSFSGCC